LLLFFASMQGKVWAESRDQVSGQRNDWREQVRAYCEARDWVSAMGLVEQEITHAPGDMDVSEWRARVFTWSGRLAEAEQEYLAILKISRNDPDKWLGLSSVYSREGKTQEALRAAEIAVELDSKRADLHTAHARALRAIDEQKEARKEFQKALALDPRSMEARMGLFSVRGEPKHEFRFGNENDLFNFTSANHYEVTSLVSKWSPGWATSVAGSFYQRGGVNAGKFVGSVTGRRSKWGAFTIGGAAGHDNAVIPKSEAFFDLDDGLKTGETGLLRGVEIAYGQHWYWYRASRILALNGMAIIYLPREWTLSVGATGARSAFSGTRAEWRPSGTSRIAFPLASRDDKHLSGNVFFATGTEDFAQVDQIGRFSAQTYGGGLRFQMTSRQDVTGYAAYQKRTQNRTDTGFGFSYGIHF
jgi:tetratricopeptide (TPR) repeat protein